MNLAKLEKKETPNHPGTTKLLEDVMNVECKKTCGTCSSFIDPQCTKTIEHFYTTKESLCLFNPPLWWSKVLPNPEAQLRGLREKMGAICGVDLPNDPRFLRLKSKLDLLELKIKTLTSQLGVEKKRADLLEKSNIDLRSRLLNIKKATEV